MGLYSRGKIIRPPDNSGGHDTLFFIKKGFFLIFPLIQYQLDNACDVDCEGNATKGNAGHPGQGPFCRTIHMLSTSNNVSPEGLFCCMQEI